MRIPLLVSALVALAACSSNDASNTKTQTTHAAAAKPASAGGALGGNLAPKDSNTDRADRGRILGDSSASVWVIMVSDFQCPYCKMWHDQEFAAVEQYAKQNRVRLAFLNYPVGGHANAVPAAEAAMCASIQNKFWPMHEGLFATQDRWAKMQNASPVFDSLATAAGVNMTAYRQCLSKHLTLPLIEADHERGRSAGVNSTPTFFVGGQTLLGADANVRGAIDAALAGSRGAKKGN